MLQERFFQQRVTQALASLNRSPAGSARSRRRAHAKAARKEAADPSFFFFHRTHATTDKTPPANYQPTNGASAPDRAGDPDQI